MKLFNDFSRSEIDDLDKTSEIIANLCNLQEYTEPHRDGGHSTIYFVKWLIDQKGSAVHSYGMPLLQSRGLIRSNNDGTFTVRFSIWSIDDSTACMCGPCEPLNKAIKRYEIIKKEVDNIRFVPTYEEFSLIAQRAGCYPDFN